MIPELGHLLLWLSLGVVTLQWIAPVWAARSGRSGAQAWAFRAAGLQFALILASLLCLVWAFVDFDFSVRYVADNSHSELPLAYRISAVWGAHEGSLLLWITMLSAWTLAVARFNRRLPTEVTATCLAVLALVLTGFLLFTLLTSNPFERQFPVPLDGADLNPLLQDPGLVIHPPMLYMGYVGFSVAFAFAIAALVSGRLDSAWARWTRPWTTAAWLFLTAGITLGSWWAYHELGWGGWWFWDPVENASFMPWLVGTALIHSLAVTEKRGLLKSWTVLLAILAFSLSLLGTFLVRSGVLISVHAFASDPERGVFILIFLALVVGSALLLYAWRGPTLRSVGSYTMFSREGLLLLNNLFLVAAAGTVLFGTLFPLVVDALGIGKVSVGPPYFNAVFLPLMLPLVLLVGLAAAVPWKRGRAGAVAARLAPVGVAAVILAIALLLLSGHWRSLPAAAVTVLGCWAIASSAQELLRRIRRPADFGRISGSIWGMSLAHSGLGVFAIGVASVSAFSIERDIRLAPGEQTEMAGYVFRFDGVQRAAGPNYDADRGIVQVLRGDRLIAELQPEKRLYRVQQNVMTDAAVDHTPLRDLYASLGEPLGDGAWSLRLYYKPMMRLVWLGGLIMALGGVLAVFDRRYRRATTARSDAVSP